MNRVGGKKVLVSPLGPGRVDKRTAVPKGDRHGRCHTGSVFQSVSGSLLCTPGGESL